MGIVILKVASLSMFSKWFFLLLLIHENLTKETMGKTWNQPLFIMKQDQKRKICKCDNVFENFDICLNKLGRISQKFAVRLTNCNYDAVTKLEDLKVLPKISCSVTVFIPSILLNCWHPTAPWSRARWSPSSRRSGRGWASAPGSSVSPARNLSVNHCWRSEIRDPVLFWPLYSDPG